MQVTRVFGIALAALVALAPAAGAVTYECALEAYTKFGCVPPKMYFILSEDHKQAVVYDSLIAEYYGEPIPASVSERSSGLVTMKWRVRNVQISNLRSKISVNYTARLNVPKMTITLTPYLDGGDFELKGGGTCKIKK